MKDKLFQLLVGGIVVECLTDETETLIFATVVNCILIFWIGYFYLSEAKEKQDTPEQLEETKP